MKFSEQIIFFKEFIDKQKQIGSIAPSSKILSKKFTSILKNNQIKSSRKILEIGSGTGVFTKEIIKNLNKSDTLYIIELNTAFVELLKEKFKDVTPSVVILCVDFLDFNTDQKFDYIFSGLPFNNFSISFLEKIFDKIKSVSFENTSFIFFEYKSIRKIKKGFDKILNNDLKKECLDTYFNDNIYPYLVKKESVYMNLPPAQINTIKFIENES